MGPIPEALRRPERDTAAQSPSALTLEDDPSRNSGGHARGPVYVTADELPWGRGSSELRERRAATGEVSPPQLPRPTHPARSHEHRRYAVVDHLPVVRPAPRQDSARGQACRFAIAKPNPVMKQPRGRPASRAPAMKLKSSEHPNDFTLEELHASPILPRIAIYRHNER